MSHRTAYAIVAGKLLVSLRSDRSQAAVAAQAGLSQSALSRFENGQSMPDLFELVGLAAVFGRRSAEVMDLINEALSQANAAAMKATGKALHLQSARSLVGFAVIGVDAIFN